MDAMAAGGKNGGIAFDADLDRNEAGLEFDQRELAGNAGAGDGGGGLGQASGREEGGNARLGKEQ